VALLEQSCVVMCFSPWDGGHGISREQSLVSSHKRQAEVSRLEEEGVELRSTFGDRQALAEQVGAPCRAPRARPQRPAPRLKRAGVCGGRPHCRRPACSRVRGAQGAAPASASVCRREDVDEASPAPPNTHTLPSAPGMHNQNLPARALRLASLINGSSAAGGFYRARPRAGAPRGAAAGRRGTRGRRGGRGGGVEGAAGAFGGAGGAGGRAPASCGCRSARNSRLLV
jgi:hypothetical protein